jgi:hypothetical protein
MRALYLGGTIEEREGADDGDSGGTRPVSGAKSS